MTIYTPIAPTYLYIKKHSITGLKYFGKTTKDPYKYHGSGTHWTRHIKLHGKEHIVTLWVSELYYDTSIVDHATHFSIENNIVESSNWANLKPENGLDGNPSGTTHSVEAKAKISAARKGKKLGPQSDEHILKLSIARQGKIVSAETKIKQSIALTGKKYGPYSIERRANISASLIGKRISDEQRAKLSANRMGKKRGPYKTKKHHDISLLNASTYKD